MDKNAFNNIEHLPEGKRQLGKPKRRAEDITKKYSVSV
jgi:hypothetical protein